MIFQTDPIYYFYHLQNDASITLKHLYFHSSVSPGQHKLALTVLKMMQVLLFIPQNNPLQHLHFHTSVSLVQQKMALTV